MTTTTDTTTIAREPIGLTEMLARIDEVGPLLRDNSLQGDRDSVLPESSIEALRSTGAWQISTMSRYGGAEGGARMLLDVARAVGRWCPSAAWITVISNGSVMLANRFDDEVLDDVFTDGGPIGMASVFSTPQGRAVREGDGWRVEGTWPFGSNANHSEWSVEILRTYDHEDDPAPGTGFALLHRSQYEIRRTWDVIGMRGTGSDHIVVDGVHIQENRVITFDRQLGDGFEGDADATFARRITPHLTMATTIAAPTLGAADAALGIVRDAAATRPVTFTTYATQTSSGAFVQGLGAASMKIDSAALLLERSADAIDATARGTAPMPRDVRARHRGGVGHAVHELVDAATDLIWLHGTASFGSRSPLGKLWRDINAGARHATVTAPVNYELHGDGLLGIDYISTKL